MVIERSRKWVKDRLPAFICKETNWWVSRWIQANVFFCPHCRKEYRSLRNVWDYLDCWETDEPKEECETDFSCKFREQFPSAFRDNEEDKAGGFLPSGFGLVGVSSVVLVLGIATAITLRTDNGYISGELAKEAEVASSVSLPNQTEDTHVNTESQQQNRVVDTSLNAQQDNDYSNDLIHPSERIVPTDFQFRTVSLESDHSYQPRGRSAMMRRHTVEINNHPVVNFSALSQAVDDGAY